MGISIPAGKAEARMNESTGDNLPKNDTNSIESDGVEIVDKRENSVWIELNGLVSDEPPLEEKKPVDEEVIIPVDVTDVKVQAVSRQTNTYNAKKTVAQGMMDVALITANANQLRLILEHQEKCKFLIVNISLISISLMLQVAVGISLIFKGRFDLKGQSKSVHARRINNYVVTAVFLITIINVFVAVFSGT